MDEFNPESCPYTYLLELCDGRPLTVQIKGGTTVFFPRKIIFTSNVDPRLWYPDVSAFFRRVSVRMHFCGCGDVG